MHTESSCLGLLLYEIHWTDFAADWELPQCQRTRDFLTKVCAEAGLRCEVLHSARAGKSSVAKRQYRVTVDIRVHPLTDPGWTATEAAAPSGSSVPILTRNKLTIKKAAPPPPAPKII